MRLCWPIVQRDLILLGLVAAAFGSQMSCKVSWTRWMSWSTQPPYFYLCTLNTCCNELISNSVHCFNTIGVIELLGKLKKIAVKFIEQSLLHLPKVVWQEFIGLVG